MQEQIAPLDTPPTYEEPDAQGISGYVTIDVGRTKDIRITFFSPGDEELGQGYGQIYAVATIEEVQELIRRLEEAASDRNKIELGASYAAIYMTGDIVVIEASSNTNPENIEALEFSKEQAVELAQALRSAIQLAEEISLKT